MSVNMKTNVSSIDAFKGQMMKRSENLVLEKFPKKIHELQQIVKNPKFMSDFDVISHGIKIPNSLNATLTSNVKSINDSNNESNVEDISSQLANQSVGDDKSGHQLVVIESNRHLQEMIAILRPQMWELIEDSLSLSVGITLMVPPIEDGNNFGVEIQQECIDTIVGIENDVHKRLREFCAYFVSRAELIGQIVKYPDSQDYDQAVQERDQAFHKLICGSLMAVRNHYITLHDIVVKNFNKIKNPKSGTSNEMLY